MEDWLPRYSTTKTSSTTTVFSSMTTFLTPNRGKGSMATPFITNPSKILGTKVGNRRVLPRVLRRKLNHPRSIPRQSSGLQHLWSSLSVCTCSLSRHLHISLAQKYGCLPYVTWTLSNPTWRSRDRHSSNEESKRLIEILLYSYKIPCHLIHSFCGICARFGKSSKRHRFSIPNRSLRRNGFPTPAPSRTFSIPSRSFKVNDFPNSSFSWLAC